MALYILSALVERPIKHLDHGTDAQSVLLQVLILGWGEESFMAMLLQELDQGPAALPQGSELTLFNSRDGLLGKIWYKAKLKSLSLLHVQGNPLDQEDLKAKVDMRRCAHVSQLHR